MIRLHHVAISVNDYIGYKELFLALGMHVERETGNAPCRQLWFVEGIQLKENKNELIGNNVEHIALGVDDSETIIEKALLFGCVRCPDKEKWFELPNAVKVELMEN